MNNQLRELRKAHSISQEDMGKLVNVSRQTIISIEAGKYDPSLPLAFKIARYFNLAIEDIFIPD